jgi:hypothetical protein
MTIELTHEEAAALRTCLAYGLNPDRLGLGQYAKWQDFNLVFLTAAGQAALAAYNAKWVPVEREKIEPILDYEHPNHSDAWDYIYAVVETK